MVSGLLGTIELVDGSQIPGQAIGKGSQRPQGRRFWEFDRSSQAANSIGNLLRSDDGHRLKIRDVGP